MKSCRLICKSYILLWNPIDWNSNHTFYYEIVNIDIKIIKMNFIFEDQINVQSDIENI